MSQLETDPAIAIPVQRSLKKSRKRWRLVAFIAIIFALLAALVQFTASAKVPRDYIARVSITGTIGSDYDRQKMFRSLAKDDNVKAVIIAINSPGGSTAGGEELYQNLKTLSESKPVVAVITELGASAAYMTAIAAEKIYARNLSIVGSIGVLFQHVDASKLLDTVGVNFEKVASGNLKAEPDFSGPIRPDVRTSIELMIDDSFQWFTDIVAQERGFTKAEVLALADGRILTGRQALDKNLIDAIGGETEAIAWLESDKDISEDLPVVIAWPKPSKPSLSSVLLGSVAKQFLSSEINKTLPLDGLVSLWQL